MPEGKVKILDFGFAKAFSGDVETDDQTNSPTLSMAATMQGVILGTGPTGALSNRAPIQRRAF